MLGGYHLRWIDGEESVSYLCSFSSLAAADSVMLAFGGLLSRL